MIWQLILYNPTKLWGVMHFLDSGLEFFTEKLRAVKNEHAVILRHFHHGKVVPRPVESQYAE